MNEVKQKYGTTNLVEIAKRLFPGADDNFINFILFEKTCFPLDNQKALEQLEQLAKERVE